MKILLFIIISICMTALVIFATVEAYKQMNLEANKVCIKQDVLCYHRTVIGGKVTTIRHDYGNCTEPYYDNTEKRCIEWSENNGK